MRSMNVGFLPSTQAQIGAHQADVLGPGHLAQVAHQGLFVVHVDDGVSDHRRRIGSRDPSFRTGTEVRVRCTHGGSAMGHCVPGRRLAVPAAAVARRRPGADPSG